MKRAKSTLPCFLGNDPGVFFKKTIGVEGCFLRDLCMLVYVGCNQHGIPFFWGVIHGAP